MEGELEARVGRLAEISQRILVKIYCGQRVAAGEAYLRNWTSPQRKKRAVMMLAKVWGLAVLFVFVPIVHFFAVPILVLLGPILAYASYSQSTVVLGGKGECPSCGEIFEIAKAADRWPLQDICDHCHEHLRIVKDPGVKKELAPVMHERAF
ncbi:MAG: hypothetical protein J5J00_06990 [Deltaproteobacteria bacterium]|nr:hypothetical protein [Deltaproteobacteria bacterium]